MKLPDTPRLLCVHDPAYGGRYPYAFGSVPATLEALGMPVLRMDIGAATPESFRRDVEAFGPDLIFGFVQELGGIRKLAGLLDAYHPVPALNWSLEDPNGVVARHGPYTMIEASARFDAWFCNDARMVPFWRTPAAFMPPGFDEVVYVDRGLDRAFDVSYVGNLGPPATARMYWPYMAEMARYGRRAMLCLDRPMGPPLLPRPLERVLRSVRLRPALQRLPLWTTGWMNPADEAEKAVLVGRSKVHVGLNRVRGWWERRLLEVVPDYPLDAHGLFYQIKGRLFHAVGAGALALNEHCPELDEMFDVGKEIVTFAYGDPTEFRDKLAWYLAHDGERERVARAGHERALRQHTWKARIGQILDFVRRAV